MKQCDPLSHRSSSAQTVVSASASSEPRTPHIPSKWCQFKVLLGKDIRQELRTREMLTSMVVYAILVLTVYGAALAQVGDQVDVLSFAGGLLWTLIVFTSLLGLNRSFAHETDSGCLEGILLAPVDRAVIFAAKATSNLIFLVSVEIIAVPLFFLFFLSSIELGETTPMILLPLVVGTIGVAGVGTLLSTLTIDTRGKDVLLAILLIPVIFPLLYSCVSATSIAFMGVAGTFDGFWASLFVATLYDVVMIAASWGLYEFAVES